MGVTKRDITIILPCSGNKDAARQLSESQHLPVLAAESDDAKSVEAAIMAAETSHVLLLKEAIKIHSVNGEWLDAALKTLNESQANSVVALNDLSGDKNAHQFQLIDKKFYVEHVHPSPYQRYFLDTEIWEKAKRLGVAARCEDSKVELISHSPDQEKLQCEEMDIFARRMGEWAGRTPGVSKKVFIALPIYGGVEFWFFQSCLHLVQFFTVNGMRKGYHEALHGAVKPLYGDSLVSRARNSLTRQFLDSDCTDLLFIDSDLKFTTRDVERIMSHPEEVVGGMYCKKQEGTPQLVINPVPDRPGEQTASGLIEVRYVGTGFLRVRRSVFEKMIAAFGESIAYKLDPDHKITEYDFWHVGVCHFEKNDYPTRYLSEDWWFCEMCKRIGVKVWADRGILLRHTGQATYPLGYQEKELYGSPADRPACPADAGVPSPSPASASLVTA